MIAARRKGYGLSGSIVYNADGTESMAYMQPQVNAWTVQTKNVVIPAMGTNEPRRDLFIRLMRAAAQQGDPNVQSDGSSTPADLFYYYNQSILSTPYCFVVSPGETCATKLCDRPCRAPFDTSRIYSPGDFYDIIQGIVESGGWDTQQGAEWASQAATTTGAAPAASSGVSASPTSIAAVAGAPVSTTSWFTDSMIGGIPNWMLLTAAGVAFLAFGGNK